MTPRNRVGPTCAAGSRLPVRRQRRKGRGRSARTTPGGRRRESGGCELANPPRRSSPNNDSARSHTPAVRCAGRLRRRQPSGPNRRPDVVLRRRPANARAANCAPRAPTRRVPGLDAAWPYRESRLATRLHREVPVRACMVSYSAAGSPAALRCPFPCVTCKRRRRPFRVARCGNGCLSADFDGLHVVLGATLVDVRHASRILDRAFGLRRLTRLEP